MILLLLNVRQVDRSAAELQSTTRMLRDAETAGQQDRAKLSTVEAEKAAVMVLLVRR